jgi:hypothetical protein
MAVLVTPFDPNVLLGERLCARSKTACCCGHSRPHISDHLQCFKPESGLQYAEHQHCCQGNAGASATTTALVSTCYPTQDLA